MSALGRCLDTGARLLVRSTRAVTCRHRSRATLVGVTHGSQRGPPRTSASRPRRRPRGSVRRRRTPGRRPLAGRYAAGGAAVRRAVRGQRPQQPGHRPAPGPLHRPGLAGRQRGPRLRRRCSDRVTDLNADIDRAHQLRSTTAQVDRYQRADRSSSSDPAGLVPRTGPGVTVTLSDAPRRRRSTLGRRRPQLPRRAPAGHPGRGQRDVEGRRHGGHHPGPAGGHAPPASSARATSVQLQGVPYPQPYGSPRSATPATLTGAIDSDAYLQVYREQAADPDIAVGWDARGRGLDHRAGVRRPARPQLRHAAALTAGRAADPPAGRRRRRHEGSAASARRRRSAGSVGRRRRRGSGSAIGAARATAARRLVRRDHDRHRRALRLAVWPAGRALLDDRALRLGGVRRLHRRPARSPASRSVCSASACCRPDHVGHLLGPVGEVDGDPGALAARCSPRGRGRSRRPALRAASDSRCSNTGSQLGVRAASRGRGLRSWPITDGTATSGLPVETMKSTAEPGSTYCVAVRGPG